MYKVPITVDNIVKHNEDEIKERMGAVCPLQGYTVMGSESIVRDGCDQLESVIGSGVGWRIDTRPIEVKGCYALQQGNLCYLERSSKKQKQVSCKENCPVYQRVQELIK